MRGHAFRGTPEHENWWFCDVFAFEVGGNMEIKIVGAGSKPALDGGTKGGFRTRPYNFYFCFSKVPIYEVQGLCEASLGNVASRAPLEVLLAQMIQDPEVSYIAGPFRRQILMWFYDTVAGLRRQ